MKLNQTLALFLVAVASSQAATCDTKTTFKTCAKKSGCYWDLENETCHEEFNCAQWDNAPGLCGENSCYYNIYDDSCVDPCDYHHYKKNACNKLDQCSYDTSTKQCNHKNCGQFGENFDGCIAEGCAFDVVTAECKEKVQCSYYDGNQSGCDSNGCEWVTGIEQCNDPCSYFHKSKSNCLSADEHCEYDRSTKECSPVNCGQYAEDFTGCVDAGCWMDLATAECKEKVECSAAADALQCEMAGCTMGSNGCIEPCAYFHESKTKCNRATGCTWDVDSKSCEYE